MRGYGTYMIQIIMEKMVNIIEDVLVNMISDKSILNNRISSDIEKAIEQLVSSYLNLN